MTWVNAQGHSLDTTIAPAVGAGQLELPWHLPLERRNPGPTPTVRYWHPSLPAVDPDDLGCFEYGSVPKLFLGRDGYGPLRIGCDTNILVDILEHGHLAFADGAWLIPDVQHGDEVEALLLLLTLWQSRDIRLVFFERQARDDRSRRRSRLAVRERHREVLELNAAWRHVVADPRPPRIRSGSVHMPGLRANADRELLTLAVEAGCHVFLTRDRGILAKRPKLERLGLVPVKPTELIGALAEANDLSPVGRDGGVCDNHKVLHLMRVIGP